MEGQMYNSRYRRPAGIAPDIVNYQPTDYQMADQGYWATRNAADMQAAMNPNLNEWDYINRTMPSYEAGSEGQQLQDSALRGLSYTPPVPPEIQNQLLRIPPQTSQSMMLPGNAPPPGAENASLGGGIMNRPGPAPVSPLSPQQQQQNIADYQGLERQRQASMITGGTQKASPYEQQQRALREGKSLQQIQNEDAVKGTIPKTREELMQRQIAQTGGGVQAYDQLAQEQAVKEQAALLQRYPVPAVLKEPVGKTAKQLQDQMDRIIAEATADPSNPHKTALTARLQVLQKRKTVVDAATTRFQNEITSILKTDPSATGAKSYLNPDYFALIKRKAEADGVDVNYILASLSPEAVETIDKLQLSKTKTPEGKKAAREIQDRKWRSQAVTAARQYLSYAEKRVFDTGRASEQFKDAKDYTVFWLNEKFKDLFHGKFTRAILDSWLEGSGDLFDIPGGAQGQPGGGAPPAGGVKPQQPNQKQLDYDQAVTNLKAGGNVKPNDAQILAEMNSIKQRRGK